MAELFFVFCGFLNLLFIFGCIESSLLRVGILWFRRAGSTLRCGACSLLIAVASLAVEHGL